MAITYQTDKYIQKNPYVSFAANVPLSNIDPPLPDVNSSLKPIDPKDATLIAEKGEVALTPEGNAYLVRGNVHSRGGTPVNLPEGSFIYSDHKPLAIPKKDQELFQFKSGGTYRKSNNTPAKVLKRQVDVPYHNQMVAVSKSDEHDDISKTSAQLMLQKNYQKLGQVAYLQEERKGFPQGLPGISEGTAPVLSTQQQNEEDIQKQYKQGGFVKPKHYQQGGSAYEGMQGLNSNPVINGFAPLHSSSQDCHPLDPDCHPSRRKLLKPALPQPLGPPDRYYDFPSGDIVNIPAKPTIDLTKTPNINIKQPDQPILPYEPHVPLTPDQLLTLGYDAYNAASVKRFFPKREQLSFTPLHLDQVNAQPYLNNVNNSVSEAYQASRGYDPIQARAMNSSLFGKALEQRSQILGNVDNQNKQISNQQAQFNTQGINATSAQNANLDSRYYDQTQMLGQNFDNEKRFAANQVMSQYNQYRSQNDALSMQLASQPTYGTVQVWKDPATGKTSRTPVQGWTPMKQALPLYDYNPRRNSIYFTGAGMDMDQLPTQQSGFSFDQVQKMADDAGLSGTARGKFLAQMMLAGTRNPYTNRRQ
jgi:hypothetical protein